MIRELLETLEDPKRRILRPNIWMTWIRLIIPERKYMEAIFIFLHELVNFFGKSEFMEIYIVRTDLNQVIEHVKTSLLTIAYVIKSNAFEKYTWKQVLDYITEADEYKRVQKDRGEIIARYTKYCRRVTDILWILTHVTYVTLVCTPLLKLLSSQNLRKSLHNGTELYPHILSTWMPINKNHYSGFWITSIWHYVYGCEVAAAYDTMTIIIMSFFGGKLDLLIELAKLKLGTPGSRIGDDEAAKTMQHLHHGHVLRLK